MSDALVAYTWDIAGTCTAVGAGVTTRRRRKDCAAAKFEWRCRGITRTTGGPAATPVHGALPTHVPNGALYTMY